jgi:prepilin-type N-terminal cleavage/methylation domain-containing protein
LHEEDYFLYLWKGKVDMKMVLKKQLGLKKGFTLVEVIVVLVILAILAAIAIPALTGYIDKANKRAAISTARTYITAMQTLLSEEYALGDSGWLDGEGGPSNTSSVSPSGNLESSYSGPNSDSSGSYTVQLYKGDSTHEAALRAEWESMTGKDPFEDWGAATSDFTFQALIDPATYKILGLGMVIAKNGAPESFVTWNLKESDGDIRSGTTYGCKFVDDSGYQVFTPEEFIEATE